MHRTHGRIGFINSHVNFRINALFAIIQNDNIHFRVENGVFAETTKVFILTTKHT
jgi:hypothetical protein